MDEKEPSPKYIHRYSRAQTRRGAAPRGEPRAAPFARVAPNAWVAVFAVYLYGIQVAPFARAVPNIWVAPNAWVAPGRDSQMQGKPAICFEGKLYAHGAAPRIAGLQLQTDTAVFGWY